MLYEVTTISDNTFIIPAGSGKEAKVKVCRDQGFRPSDRWTGISSMKARKIQVDYPETIYRQGCYSFR